MDYKLPVLGCQCLSVPNFLGFKPNRFSQNDLVLDFKYRFTAALSNMDVDGRVLVAIEEKPEAILGKNVWHRRTEQRRETPRKRKSKIGS
jgi:hypothetical protein